MWPLGKNHLKVLANLRDKGLVDHITVVDISKQVRDLATLADETKSSMDGVKADFVVVATPQSYTQNTREN